jgi:regulator of protease activity HflC (stomatin/prohibitin superfamily)
MEVKMTQSMISSEGNRPVRQSSQTTKGMVDRLFKLATILLATVVVLVVVLVVGRSAVYKIHAYERGLHLRGGRFVSVDDPGWHVQIPLVDTVIIVKVNERLGYVEQVPAMTSDDVTMDVSLQYTYRVSDPQRFALEVDDPERIIFEFVQGKLRDVVNTKEMTEVMHSRAEMNTEVMAALREKEEQYGVKFITVQIQSASPPEEVVTAIKDRMVAVQRQEQAQAEAAQRRTLADAEYYAAQKQADGSAYEITALAEADAQRIALTSAAEREAMQATLTALQGKGDLGAQYIQLLIAEQLKDNSKWIISGGSGETVPVVELRTTGE